MLVELLIFLVIVLLLYDRWSRREVYKLGKQLSCRVKAYPLIGHSYLFLGNNHKRMEALQILGRDALKNDNGLFPAWQGNYLYTMIVDPEAAEIVLKTCLEKDDIMQMATLFVGKGSIFAPVSIWRPRRKVLVPTFNMKNLKSFVTIFVRHSTILVQELGKVVGAGPLSAFKHYTAYTMDAIAESTLGYKMDAQKSSDHPFLKAFNYGLPKCAERLCQPWLHSDLIYNNLPVYARLVKLKEYLWGFMIELIKAKRKEIKYSKQSKDTENSPEGNIQTFLECLIRSSGGDDGYTDIEILEELMVIMVAGNDTSAVGTSFISLLLSRHPEVQEKVYEELQEVFGDSDRLATFEDLPRLKYLDAVIRETLRLYPPVPIIVRKVENHVPLPSGITLVPGTGVLVNIWALHRNPRYWGDDAEQFRPERFLDTPLQHPAAFMAFSHGPRNCAGYQYAMLSMKTVLSTVLRRFKFLPAVASDGSFPPLRLTFDLMMKDVNNFQIRLEPRIKC
ncbi:cytochrome P450 4C1-like [Spodoptera litura]|uniref:Cytochrome P450 4C1-like n=1 Tax=Spodoptera litura TaxID=69820 RepID=A0A9J7IKM7_SPOLT|nr:cytochrome P450 4C1-like [Spodoptera litura]